MPQLVSVDGVGTVEFPDEATESEIILTLNRDYPSPERKSLMEEMESARTAGAVGGAVESGITAAEQLAQGASLGGWMQNIGNVQESISPGTQQTKENATRMAGQFIGETIKTPLDFLIPEAQEETRREYSSGLGQAAAGLVTGLPEALPLIAAGAAAGPAYATTVTSKFATDMALGGYELLKAAKQAEAEGDTAAAKNLNAQALASLGMAGTIVAPPVFRGVVSRVNPRAIPRPEKKTVSAEDISTIAEPTPLTPVSIPELAVQTARESVTKAGETVGAVDVSGAFKTAKDNAAAQIASARASIEAARNRQLGTTPGAAGQQVIAAGGLPEAASKAMAGSVSATLEAGKQAPGIASQAAIDRAGLALGKAEKSITESTESVEGLNRIVADVGDLIASIDNLQKMGIVPTPVSQNPLEEAANRDANQAAVLADGQGLKIAAAQVAEPPKVAPEEVPVETTAGLGGTPTEQTVVSVASPTGTPAPITPTTAKVEISQQPEVPNAIPIRETAPLPVAEAPKAGAEVGAPVRQQAAQVQPEAKVAQQPSPATTKEPWQMTRQEYAQKHIDEGGLFGVGGIPFKASKATKTGLKQEGGKFIPYKKITGIGQHKYDIEQAIRDRKQVPPEVLADYPDLAKLSPAPTVTPAPETLPSAAQGTETQKPTLAQQPGATAEGTPPVGPGIVGMGAAVPADYNVSTGATAMKYRQINEDRVKRGQEEIPKPESVSDQQAVDRAMAEIDKFDGFPDKLADEIINNPRTIDDWESHALLIRRVDYRNEMFKAADAMKKALEDGRIEDAQAAQGQYSYYGQKLDNIEIASRLSGSERGRALRALRVLMNEDYSLEKLRNDLRVAKGVERTEGGRWITPEEEAQIQKIADDYARLQEEIKKREGTVEVEQSQNALDETVKNIKGEIQKDHNNGKKAPTPDVADATRVKLIAKVKSKIAHGKSEEIHPQIYKLERLLIESGIRDRDALVDAIHSFFPELTRREVSDAMSGYGNFKPLSKDAISIIQRDIHGQLQQISKLEDLQAKVPLKKSGIERRVESAEERRLKKQVEEYKRRYGVVVTDPATQLKSAMDARKTRLRHEIEDMEFQIKEGEKIVRTKLDPTKDPSYEEYKELIRLRDEKKAEFNLAFPKQELTYEQQVALAVASLDREIAKVQDQIKTGKIFTEAKQQLTSPEIEVKRSQLDALRQERQQLRDLDEGYKEKNIQAELDRIEKRASELQDQINAGDVLAKKTATKVVDPRIEAARAEVKELNKVKQQLRNQLKEKKPWEQIALQTLKTRLTRELADYKERIANGDFVKREPRKFPLDPTTTALKFEVQKIKHAWNVKKQEEAYKNLSRLDKAKAFTASSMDATRKLMTSFDLSAVLRQGGFLGFAHPVRSAKILLDRKFWNAVNTEKGIHAENERIMNRDNAPNYLRDKLFLADQNGKLSGQEEVYMNKSWVDRIPGIGKSERAYVAFLNRLRVDSYDAMAAGLKKGAELTPEEGRAIANYINIATGRGTLFENAMVGMSRVFFAPRYVTSQLQMMYGSPMWLYKKGEWTPGRVRKMIAKDYMRQLTGLMVFYGLGMLAGGQLETDWRSSDFMSLSYGNTHVNPVKGMAQLGVLIGRTKTGEKLNARGIAVPIRGEGVKYGGGKLDSEYWKFLRKKAAPYPGAALDILSGEDVLGREITPLEVGKKLVTPMSIPQLVELLRENGVPAAVALGALNQLGVSVQTYDERLFNPR